MADNIATIAQFKKAGKLVRLSMRRNGPRSYNRGVGILLRAFEGDDILSRNKLIEATGWSRHNLKNIVKKAEKKGLVKLVKAEEAHTYLVEITTAGKDVLKKRTEAQIEAAAKMLEGFSEEEIAQLNALTEKLILNAKADGKVCAYGKGYKFHKGHKGHRPHAELA